MCQKTSAEKCPGICKCFRNSIPQWQQEKDYLFLISMVWIYTDTSVVVTDKEAQFMSTDLLYTNELCGEKSKG